MTTAFSRQVQELVETLFRNGDPAKPQFRRICYAAAANSVKNFGLRRAYPAGEFEQLLERLVGELQQIEAKHGGALSAKDEAVLAVQMPEARERVEAPAAAPSKPRGWRWRQAMMWTVFGASLLALAIWGLEKTGVILVRTDPADFARLAARDEDLAYLKGPAENSISALNKTTEAVEADVAAGKLKPAAGAPLAQHNVSSLYPQLYQSFQNSLPKGSYILILIANTGGYKVVARSEVCPWIAYNKPELVDPVRSFYPGSCQFYGFWNSQGRNL